MAKLNTELLPTKLLPRRATGGKAGRPIGSLSPTPRDRMERTLPLIYESVRRNALAGDANSARLCADIVREPEKFPLSDSRAATHGLDG